MDFSNSLEPSVTIEKRIEGYERNRVELRALVQIKAAG